MVNLNLASFDNGEIPLQIRGSSRAFDRQPLEYE